MKMVRKVPGTPETSSNFSSLASSLPEILANPAFAELVFSDKPFGPCLNSTDIDGSGTVEVSTEDLSITFIGGIAFGNLDPDMERLLDIIRLCRVFSGHPMPLFSARGNYLPIPGLRPLLTAVGSGLLNSKRKFLWMIATAIDMNLPHRVFSALGENTSWQQENDFADLGLLCDHDLMGHYNTPGGPVSEREEDTRCD
jgi:hypothetical protein